MRKILAGVLALAVGLSVIGVSQQDLDSGTFFFQLDEDAGIEGFAFTELEDGNFQMSSDFEALSEQLIFDFGTDRLFNQEITLSPDLELIRYELTSETIRGTFSATVVVEGGIASISTTSQEPDEAPVQEQRDVILTDEFVTTGIAASQFFLMQRFINENFDLAIGDSEFVTAFDPTDVDEPFVELTFERLNNVIVEDVNTRAQFEATQISVQQEGQFSVELIACAVTDVPGICEEEGRFLGFLSSTATLAGVVLGNAPNNGGALVESVAPGSFAEDAGLQENDIITEIDGEDADEARDLRNEIRFSNPDLPVTLTVDRGGETLEIEVRLSGSLLQVYRFDLFEAGFTILGEA